MSREISVTGLGVISPIGQGKAAFTDALLAGRSAFKVMTRPGRQSGSAAYFGAEIDEMRIPEGIGRRARRAASLSSLAALAVLDAAWRHARLSVVDSQRVRAFYCGSIAAA